MLFRKPPLLKSKDPLTQEVRNLGIKDWAVFVEYIRMLPYGRNKNRTDMSLVLKEGRGSCSSKHALLKSIADINKIDDVTLWLVMFKMNGNNTPAIKELLDDSNFEFIPEAHCVIQQYGFFTDVTHATSSFDDIEFDVLESVKISPKQVGKYKVDYHQKYLKAWLEDQGRSEMYNELWSLREACIKALATKRA